MHKWILGPLPYHASKKGGGPEAYTFKRGQTQWLAKGKKNYEK